MAQRRQERLGGRHPWARQRCVIAVPCSVLVPYRVVSSPTEVPDITKSFVNHVNTSLARQAYNLDDFGAYQAAALSTRDNLIVRLSMQRSARDSAHNILVDQLE